jgi:MoaA/NifB/PqqE/SkfB family radical SAM enzyme
VSAVPASPLPPATAPKIERFIWDLTYTCPLRCIHCLTESGRRAARTLPSGDALRVAEVIIGARPQRVSLSGGEPLTPRWWPQAARKLSGAGITVTMFTSGWLMDEKKAAELAGSVTQVAVSIDGASPAIHDAVRGRAGSYDKTIRALEILCARKRAQRQAGQRCYTIAADYTVTRTGQHGLAEFTEQITGRFPELDVVRFGAVVPVGIASEEAFVASELLSYEDLAELAGSGESLSGRAQHGTEVQVTDVRYFLPESPLSDASATIAHIEPDGQLRAFTNYEAKVGNVLTEPLDVLWARALAWRCDPFVTGQLHSIKTAADWARVTRTLDRRYGSAPDQARIARRPDTVRYGRPRPATIP